MKENLIEAPMSEQVEIRIIGEYNERKAELVLCIKDMWIDITCKDELLLSCDLRIVTEYWQFSGNQVFTEWALQRARADLAALIEQKLNEVRVESADEETWIRFLLINKAKGAIEVQGSIVQQGFVARKLQEPPRHLRVPHDIWADARVQFFGFWTDQSYLHEPLAQLTRLLHEIEKVRQSEMG